MRRRSVPGIVVLLVLLVAAPAAAVTSLPTAGDADYQLGGNRSAPETGCPSCSATAT